MVYTSSIVYDKKNQTTIFYRNGMSFNKNFKSGAILFNKEMNQVVLVKNKTTQKWGFPKGHANPKESLIECCRREVKEETNLDINSCGTIYRTVKLQNYHYFLVILNKNECFDFKINDEDEIEQIAIIDIVNIPKLNTNASLKVFYKKFTSSNKYLFIPHKNTFN